LPQSWSRGAPLDATPVDVPGYELCRILGRGGTGIVWEAIERRSGRRVAVKVLAAATAEGVRALEAEACLTSTIQHPGVVRIHEVGRTAEGRPYVVMELVEGGELGGVLAGGWLSEPRAALIAAEIADAIAAAHAHGVVHCDLKPSNVLLDHEGRVRLVDFGLARRLADAADRVPLRGSAAYVSPEQIDGRAPGVGSDIHAIGVILYEMLTGRRPYVADSIHPLLFRIACRAPEPPSVLNPSVSEDVERACLRCLEKRPEDRFPTARELADALFLAARKAR